MKSCSGKYRLIFADTKQTRKNRQFRLLFGQSLNWILVRRRGVCKTFKGTKKRAEKIILNVAQGVFPGKY